MKKINFQTIHIALFLVIVFILGSNFIYFPGNILSWDIFGYYLYLPFQFIYHDLGLKDMNVLQEIVQKYHNSDTLYQILNMPEGGAVMKYSMGMSFFYAPFFFIGHAVALVFGLPADGFSAPYQYSIFAGGIIYSILGIWFLSKVLRHFFNDKISGLILLLLVFATNFPIHNAMYGQNAMSHNILFFTYSLILWLTIKWHETHKMKFILGLAIFCGLTILSRPSEIVCLLIPLLWNVKNLNTLRDKIRLLWNYKVQIGLFIAIIAFIGSFQLVYWKIHTGKFLYYSYGANAGEGFEFLSPYIMQVLFSFRKGWLVYTPIMVFAITGFVVMFKKNKMIFLPLFLYFLINLYIVSSWSCWWYAQSYSQRPLIPSYPVMAIALGYFFVWLFDQKKWLKTGLSTLLMMILALNLFQIHQFTNGIIDGDRMTKAYYFRTFGKLHATDEDRKLLMVNRSFNGEEYFVNNGEYHLSHTLKSDFGAETPYDSATVLSAQNSMLLDSNTLYSKAIEIPYSGITDKDHAWLCLSAWVYPTIDVVSNPFCLVIQFTHKGFAYKYKTIDSEKLNLKLNAWNELKMDYLTPEVRKKADQLKVYFWLRGKQPLNVGSIRLSVYEKR